MIFEHCDTNRTFFIPAHLCDIGLFIVRGRFLILPTGEAVEFSTNEKAETAWSLFQECFRDKANHLFYQDCCEAYGYYRD